MKSFNQFMWYLERTKHHDYPHYRKIIEYSKNAKIFVISQKVIENTEFSATAASIVSFPFKTCWFERLPAWTGELSAEGRPIGHLITEINPQEFNVVEFNIKIGSQNSEEIEYYVVTIKIHLNKINEDSASHIANIQYLYEMLQSKTIAIGQESVNERFKIKHNGERTDFRVRKIINIFPKKMVKNKEPGLPTNVQWSHRWLVMGHWRKATGLGKDREGNYCIENYTWVVDHQKGPGHLPLVADKVRFIRPAPTTDQTDSVNQ